MIRISSSCSCIKKFHALIKKKRMKPAFVFLYQSCIKRSHPAPGMIMKQFRMLCCSLRHEHLDERVVCSTGRRKYVDGCKSCRMEPCRSSAATTIILLRNRGSGMKDQQGPDLFLRSRYEPSGNKAHGSAVYDGYNRAVHCPISF